MAGVNITCIGKLKEKYFKDAQAEYVKRLTAFCTPRIIEKKEYNIPKGSGSALIEKAQQEESNSLLPSSPTYLIALSPDGEKMTSEAFAALVSKRAMSGSITFAIGGSYGLSQDFKVRADKVLSFSDMTMPHQLFRIVLLEQIYRAFMISSNRTYHK